MRVLEIAHPILFLLVVTVRVVFSRHGDQVRLIRCPLHRIVKI